MRGKSALTASLLALAACTSPLAARPDAGADLPADIADDAGLSDLADVWDVPDLPDLPDLPDIGADIDTQTQDAAVAIAADATWAAPAWPSACVPEGTTATTVGPVGPPPNQCSAHDCTECGPVDQCTCQGDGNTPCAWKAIAQLPFPLQDARHVWGDGRLYLFGGSVGAVMYPTADPFKSYGFVQTAEIWDPKTDTWHVTPHAPTYILTTGGSLAYGNGRLYVGGGNVAFEQTAGNFKQLPWGPSYAEYAVYDPGSDSWSALPAKGSPGACGGLSPMAFINGKLIVPGCAGFLSDPAWKTGPPAAYDPVSSSWEALPKIPGALIVNAYFGAKLSGPDLVFLNHKYEGNDLVGWNVVVFHGKSWSWTVHDGPPFCNGALTVPDATIGFGDGLLFFVGSPWPFAWIWWQASDKWELVPVPKWLAPGQHDVPVWNGNEFTIRAGTPESPSAVFNPATKMWRQMASHGQPLSDGAEVATSVGARSLYIGGQYAGATLSHCTSILVPAP